MATSAECADTQINQNQPTVTTLSVKLAQTSRKQMHIMQFTEAQHVDFADWKRAHLRREDNCSLYTLQARDEPKFGAGSEFGRASREEAMIQRIARKYKPENQPWILTTNTVDSNKRKRDNDKSFKGLREGGVGENSAYYIFVRDTEGTGMIAYPVNDWYKFQSIQRYKTLSAEEAEEEFVRRQKMLNFFSVMAQKRLRCMQDIEGAKNQAPTRKKKIRGLKISEIDDWISSSEDSGTDQDNKSMDSDKDKKKKKGKQAPLKKKRVSDDEAFEESDDGDEEGREREYITDSSASERELEQQREEGHKSVAEEPGLKELYSSGSESQENKENQSEYSDEEEARGGKRRPGKEKSARDKSANRRAKGKENESPGGNLSSAAASGQKRTTDEPSDGARPKRPKRVSAPAPSDFYIQGASESGVTIGAVTKYLKRKPMTLVDLLKKFKSKKYRLSNEKKEDILLRTLKKMNPNTKKINGVIYYSL